MNYKMGVVKLFENFFKGIPLITTDLLNWHKDTKSFSADVSDLRGVIVGGEKQIIVKNPLSGTSVTFDWVKTDMDGSGEDIYGWNYVNKEHALKMLIAND